LWEMVDESVGGESLGSQTSGKDLARHRGSKSGKKGGTRISEGVQVGEPKIKKQSTEVPREASTLHWHAAELHELEV